MSSNKRLQSPTDLSTSSEKRAKIRAPLSQEPDALIVDKPRTQQAVEAEREKKKASCHDHVMKEIECPVCCNVMAEEILQCTNGHSLCKPCRKKVAIEFRFFSSVSVFYMNVYFIF